MELTTYIKHPELLDATAVDELSRLVGAHPYFQAARLLLVRGLYQLQAETFGHELRRAALCLPDRTRLFEFIEGPRFRPEPDRPPRPAAPPPAETRDRTQSLIDSFLAQLPEEPQPRRPRAVDAAVDYTGYLLQLEDAPAETAALSADGPAEPLPVRPSAPPDAEASAAGEAARPSEIPTSAPQPPAAGAAPSAPLPGIPSDDPSPLPAGLGDEPENEPSEAFFTETLARIYIKQGKYAKAIEIIRRLSLNFPKKNRYFADQIRFLEKLMLIEASRQPREEEAGSPRKETN